MFLQQKFLVVYFNTRLMELPQLRRCKCASQLSPLGGVEEKIFEGGGFDLKTTPCVRTWPYRKSSSKVRAYV